MKNLSIFSILNAYEILRFSYFLLLKYYLDGPAFTYLLVKFPVINEDSNNETILLMDNDSRKKCASEEAYNLTPRHLSSTARSKCDR